MTSIPTSIRFQSYANRSRWDCRKPLYVPASNKPLGRLNKIIELQSCELTLIRGSKKTRMKMICGFEKRTAGTSVEQERLFHEKWEKRIKEIILEKIGDRIWIPDNLPVHYIVRQEDRGMLKELIDRSGRLYSKINEVVATAERAGLAPVKGIKLCEKILARIVGSEVGEASVQDAGNFEDHDDVERFWAELSEGLHKNLEGLRVLFSEKKEGVYDLDPNCIYSFREGERWGFVIFWLY